MTHRYTIFTGMAGLSLLLLLVGYVGRSEVPVNLAPSPEVALSTEVPGMKSRALRVTPRGAALSVNLRSEPWCDEGDFDFIQRDLAKSKHGRLIVSVEPLSAADDSRLGRRFVVPLQDIIVGKVLTFDLPRTIEPMHLGLFVCKDSTGTGRCLGKDVVSTEALHGDQAHSPDIGVGIAEEAVAEPVISGEPTDKIYYFSYLLVEQGVVRVLDNQMDSGAYQQLEGYLNRMGTGPDRAQQLVGMISDINRKLSSGGVDLSKEMFEINLPRAAPGSCPGSSSYVQLIDGQLVDLEVKNDKIVLKDDPRALGEQQPEDLRVDGKSVLLPLRSKQQ